MRKSSIIIWSLIFADLLSGLLQILEKPFFRVGLLLKSGVMLFLFVYYLIKLPQKTFRSIYVSIAILFAFWSIGSSISFFVNPAFDYANSFVVLNRYLLFFILACAFLDWSSDQSFEYSAKRIFEIFLIINNFFISIGFVFEIDIFSTYDPYNEYDVGQRFGYKGLIFGQNAVAAIYTLGMAYLFRETFVYRRSKYVLLFATCFAAVLVGTKATLITLLLIGVYYVACYRPKLLIILVVPALAGVIYAIISYWPYLQANYLQFIIDKYQTMDFISFWTSNRNALLDRALNYVEKEWAVINYLTGDAHLYVEMDFFDLYFFFGLGAAVYLFIYVKIFFIRDNTRDNRYFFVVLMAMALIAGHIINSAIVPVFYLLYIFSASPNHSRHTINNAPH